MPITGRRVSRGGNGKQRNPPQENRPWVVAWLEVLARRALRRVKAEERLAERGLRLVEGSRPQKNPDRGGGQVGFRRQRDDEQSL